MLLSEFEILKDLNLLSETEKLQYIEQLKREHFLCGQMEATAKTELVSIYGALGNENYAFYNPDIAEAITLQGQDAIKFSEKMTNDYFMNHFHLDYELHKHLGISENFKVPQIKRPVVVYCDTDSNYCSLDEVMKAIKWDKDPKDMVLLIYEHRLKNYFNELFSNYVKELNGMGNFLKFEMETISSIGLFIAKKKYIHSMVWKDGVHIPNFSNLKVTGLEIVQRSTPIFCRTHLKDSVKKILQIGGLATGDGTLQTFIHNLKEIKKAHKLSNLENICKNNKISNYHKFVINDKETLEFRPRCPIHIKAAATFNHLVSINNLCDKYEFITTGDSVKWYYTADKKYPVFGFPSGKYPENFAPKFDYKVMFEKTFVDVVNRFINAMIANTNLDYSLSFTSDIF